MLIIDNELQRETSANRIPKVMQARGIPLADVADRLLVANVRGMLKDVFGRGAWFERVTPGGGVCMWRAKRRGAQRVD